MAECIFCQIAAGKIPAQIVYQDESVVAFKDIYPKAPIHVLLIPRKHIPSLADLAPGDNEVMGRLMAAVNSVALLVPVFGNGRSGVQDHRRR